MSVAPRMLGHAAILAFVMAGSVYAGAPPCREDEWAQTGVGTEAGQCFTEFVGLSPRVALRGHCLEGDCRSGLGTLQWPGGASYVGGFRAGKRHGQGTFRWPDGRAYIGEWHEGQPSGLGTRVFANGRYKAGYFDRGRYLGVDVAAVESLARRPGAETGNARPEASAVQAASPRSCEEACTEDSELRLGRISDEYECCYARHAFCSQKAKVARVACTSRACRGAASQQQEECDLHYACDAVQSEKVARYRSSEATCVVGCSSQHLDEQGLRISERGTLIEK